MKKYTAIFLLLLFITSCSTVKREWEQVAEMPTPRYNAGICVYNDEIYVIGGSIGSGRGSDATSIVEVYNPKTNRWRHQTDLISARTHPSVCVLNDKIYVIGGTSKEEVSPLAIVDVYDPYMDTWTRKADMPTPRAHLIAFEVDDKIYAIGGATRSGTKNAVEEYDPAYDEWTGKTDMLTPRTGLSGCVIDNKIFVIGGSLRPGRELVATVEVYNSETNSWSSIIELSQPRVALNAATVNNKIYAIAGSVNRWPMSPVGIVEALNFQP